MVHSMFLPLAKISAAQAPEGPPPMTATRIGLSSAMLTLATGLRLCCRPARPPGTKLKDDEGRRDSMVRRCNWQDCVDGVLRLLFSDLAEPINLGSDELISMNDFATMIMQFRKDGPLPIKHLEGPLGVRGRNSNNDFIKKKLGWAPSIPVKVGIEKTFRWIESQIEKEVAAGAKMTDYVSSKIVVQSTESLDKLNDAVPPTNGAYPSTNGKH